MKKVCFLFGAGAEGKGNYNLPNGPQFMKKSFLDKELKEALTNALKNHFGGSYFSGSYSYSVDSYLVNPTFRSILKKWINQTCKDPDYYDKYEHDIRRVMNRDDLKELRRSIGLKEIKRDSEKDNDSDDESGNDDKIIEVFRSLFNPEETFNRVEIENSIRGSILESFVSKIGDEGVTFIPGLETSISHILDGHFHTIINPAKFGRIKFSKVFNYYWSIFFAIYGPIAEIWGKKKITDYGQELRSLKKNIEGLYENSAKIGSTISQKNRQKTYYESIVDEFKGRPITGVLTSNYFSFAEIITDKVAYLNGQLRLFEIPEALEVIDIKGQGQDFPKDKLYFPFIMGQSYTKPIISRHQICAFHKMGKILDKADILIILGYNVNEDDNHINAYLRDFLLKGEGKTIMVNSDNVEDLKTSLKLSNSKGSIIGIDMKSKGTDPGNGSEGSSWLAPEIIIRDIRQKVEAKDQA